MKQTTITFRIIDVFLGIGYRYLEELSDRKSPLIFYFFIFIFSFSLSLWPRSNDTRALAYQIGRGLGWIGCVGLGWLGLGCRVCSRFIHTNKKQRGLLTFPCTLVVVMGVEEEEGIARFSHQHFQEVLFYFFCVMGHVTNTYIPTYTGYLAYVQSCRIPRNKRAWSINDCGLSDEVKYGL